MKPRDQRTNPTRGALTPEQLADLALDGDAPLDAVLSRDPSGRAAGHVRGVRRLERLLRLEKSSRQHPDLTAAVLDEVGARRGWLDERSRRMVWAGRGLAAAALLGAFAALLGVRNAAPELKPATGAPAALASVVDAGERAASEASAPLAGVVEMIDGGRPVLVHVGATFSRAGGADSGPAAPRVYQIRLDEPAIGSCVRFVRSARPADAPASPSAPAAPQGPAHAQASVLATLDAASRRTVSAVVGIDRTPRWLRAKTFPASAPAGSWE